MIELKCFNRNEIVERIRKQRSHYMYPTIVMDIIKKYFGYKEGYLDCLGEYTDGNVFLRIKYVESILFGEYFQTYVFEIGKIINNKYIVKTKHGSKTLDSVLYIFHLLELYSNWNINFDYKKEQRLKEREYWNNRQENYKNRFRYKVYHNEKSPYYVNHFGKPYKNLWKTIKELSYVTNDESDLELLTANQINKLKRRTTFDNLYEYYDYKNCYRDIKRIKRNKFKTINYNEKS